MQGNDAALAESSSSFYGRQPKDVGSEMDITDLDISWIDDDIEELEKEPMNTIQVYAVYVDCDRQAIHLVTKTQCQLAQSPNQIGSQIPNDKLLYMIHKMKSPETNRNVNPPKYRISDIILVNLDFLESNKLKSIDQELTKNPIIKQVLTPNIGDLHIPPSIYIFHDINCLYFIFQELEKDADLPKPRLQIHHDLQQSALSSMHPGTSGLPASVPVSALPPSSGLHKKTKKVTFKEDYRHTKRHIHTRYP